MRLSRSRASVPVVLLPIALFVAHGSVFTGWIVDDAGISLAYAKNFASGHGLVAQPGDTPVEGFSNPLWVMLFAALYRLDLVDPFVTPKLVSGASVALSFFIGHRVLANALPNGGAAALLGLVLASLQTAFVVWCVSGLENPLYLLLIVALFAQCVRCSEGGPMDAAKAGGLAGLVAVTRPEGILYSAVVPIWMALSRSGLTALRLAVTSLAATALVAGAYMVFRLAYFGDLLPNPYYAKGGPGIRSVAEVVLIAPATRARVWELLLAALGPIGGVAAGAIAVAGLVMAARRRLRPIHLLLVLLTATSLAGYLLLPPDWMAEYRFATPFFLLFYLTLATAGVSVAQVCGRWGWVALGATATALVTSVSISSIDRSEAFSRHPTISLVEVFDRVERFRDLASYLQVENPTLLIADVGATLLQDHIRTIDLGMLTNREIARWLGERGEPPNHAAFHDYLFERVRPTFLSIRAYHTWRARLDLDPRFEQSYAPLATYKDDWILNRVGLEMESGDYVRRDAVRAAGREMAELREGWEFR